MIISAVPAQSVHADDLTSKQYLKLSDAQSFEDLSRSTYIFAETGRDLSIQDVASDPDRFFDGLQDILPNYGFTKSRIWMKLNLENSSESVDTWYLHSHINFLQNYDIYLRRTDGRIEHLETHGLDTVFEQRSVEFPELATEFKFQPKEKIELYIVYWSGGSSKISFSIETDVGFAQKSVRQNSKNFVSYGMMTILIIVSLLALLLLRKKVFLDYSIYVIVTLIFLMHSDGTAFQYFWPDSPRFNSYFSIIIGLAFAVVPYNFARTFLRTKLFHPRLDKLMVWIMIITPIIIIPLAFINPQITKKILVMLVLNAIVIGTIAGFIASIKRFKEVRFYLFAWILGVLSAGMMNLRYFTALDVVRDMELDSIRVSIVVDALMMGLGVADRYRQQIKAGRDEQQRALEQAELNLALSNRLSGLEEQYRLVSELAASRDESLQNTIHDLRQPIHALRLNLKSLQMDNVKGGGNGSSGATDKFDETFEYLEGLISNYLQKSVSPQSGDDAVESEYVSTVSELNLSKTLASIHEMFLPDALEKNIEFKYIDTQLESKIEPFALMRIVSNLISNAIKYTPSGKVLLCARKLGDQIRIEVHDTGLGMSDDEFEEALVRDVRLHKDVADGQGIGLSIAHDLAQKNKCKLVRLKRSRSGTSIALILPQM